MAAFTDISPYVDTHGLAPVGTGQWAFLIAGDREGRRCQGSWYASGSFPDACRSAFRAARAQRWDADSITLTLLP